MCKLLGATCLWYRLSETNTPSLGSCLTNHGCGIHSLKKFEIEYDEKYLFEWIEYIAPAELMVVVGCDCYKQNAPTEPRILK